MEASATLRPLRRPLRRAIPATFRSSMQTTSNPPASRRDTSCRKSLRVATTRPCSFARRRSSLARLFEPFSQRAIPRSRRRSRVRWASRTRGLGTCPCSSVSPGIGRSSVTRCLRPRSTPIAPPWSLAGSPGLRSRVAPSSIRRRNTAFQRPPSDLIVSPPWHGPCRRASRPRGPRRAGGCAATRSRTDGHVRQPAKLSGGYACAPTCHHRRAAAASTGRGCGWRAGPSAG